MPYAHLHDQSRRPSPQAYDLPEVKQGAKDWVARQDHKPSAPACLPMRFAAERHSSGTAWRNPHVCLPHCCMCATAVARKPKNPGRSGAALFTSPRILRVSQVSPRRSMSAPGYARGLRAGGTRRRRQAGRGCFHLRGTRRSAPPWRPRSRLPRRRGRATRA